MTNRIVLDPKILAGKPVIKGTRIPVEFVLDLLASGMNVEEIVNEYPHLKKEDILAVLEYASQVIRNEDIYPSAQVTA